MRGHLKTRLALVFVAAVLTAGCGDTPIEVNTAAAPAGTPAAPAEGRHNPGQGQAGIRPPVEPPAPPVITAAEEAAAEGKPDKASPAERADKVYRLDGEDGNQFLTPAPKAIKAKHDAKEARAAAEGPGDMSPDMKAKGPSKATFGLFTDQYRDVAPDGTESNQRVNRPVWVLTWERVPVVGSGPPSCVGPPVEVGPVVRGSENPDCPAQKPASTLGTVQYIIDDTTGKALKSITRGSP